MGVQNFKHLLIFIPKCIELKSVSKLKLILGLGVTQDPVPFFLAERMVTNHYISSNFKVTINVHLNYNWSWI